LLQQSVLLERNLGHERHPKAARSS
jgi:hypothetical protein